MGKATIQWFKITDSAHTILWQANNMCVVDVNNKKISLGKHENKIFAFAHKCPHAGGVLANGFLDATGNVVCPLHRYKFNLQNGRNTSGEGYYLKTYLVDEKADGIYIGFEEKSFFSFL